MNTHILRCMRVVILIMSVSKNAAQRTLKWNVTWNSSIFADSFRSANADVINLACRDPVLSSALSTSTGTYVQGSDSIAQATYVLAMCSYLRPNASAAVKARIAANTTLQAVANNYRTFSNVNDATPFLRYCCIYDLLKPDLSAEAQQNFTKFVGKLIYDATAYLNNKEFHLQRDNIATTVVTLRAICAQAINNVSSVAETRTRYISSLLSPDETVANLYQNGTSYDFFARDALFYHVGTVTSFVELARRMPDGFFTKDQWQLVERAIYFVKQFYLPACMPACVFHREFMTTQYAPDQTTLHGNLYGTIWPNISFQATPFMYLSRISFVSVRSWTTPMDGLVRARTRTQRLL